jgi:transporter family protein
MPQFHFDLLKHINKAYLMNSWLFPATLSLFCFGLWGFFGKLSTHYIDAKSAAFFQTVGFALSGVIVLFLIQFKPTLSLKGDCLATLTGFCTGIGSLFFIISLFRGKTSTIITFTSLYPAITVLLSVLLLHETISFKQCIGICLAITSVVLLAS